MQNSKLIKITDDNRERRVRMSRVFFNGVVNKILLILMTIFLTVSLAAKPAPVQAAAGPFPGPGWVVILSQEEYVDPVYGSVRTTAVYTMDSEDHTLYGPFLVEELVLRDSESNPFNSGATDVAVTPDGQTAVLIDPGHGLLHFVSLKDPTAPAFLKTINLGYPFDDVVISPDGQFALVCGETGVFSFSISRQKFLYHLYIPTYEYNEEGDAISGSANAIVVSENGTIVIADRLTQAVHTARLWSNGALTYYSSHKYYLDALGQVSLTEEEGTQRFAPINLSLSPDGMTVLVSDSLNYVDTTQTEYDHQYTIGVYQLTTPGHVAFDGVVSGLPRVMQSIDFNADGTEAYALGNGGAGFDQAADPQTTLYEDGLYKFTISDGVVNFDDAHFTDLGFITTSQYLGVDTLVVYQGMVYLTYADDNLNATDYPNRYFSIVDVSDFSLTQLDWGLTTDVTPTGVAMRVFIPYQTFIPMISK